MLLFSSFHKPRLISRRKSDGVIDNTKPLAELYSWFWHINSALSIICQKSVAYCRRIQGKSEFGENKKSIRRSNALGKIINHYLNKSIKTGFVVFPLYSSTSFPDAINDTHAVAIFFPSTLLYSYNVPITATSSPLFTSLV